MADRSANRPRRLNPYLKTHTDGPPKLSPIDRIISLHNGSTTAIEATPQRLQESKQYPIPSSSERITQLQKQNSSLNHEVAYYRAMEQSRIEFEHEVVQVNVRLERALFNLSKNQQKVGDEWIRLGQGDTQNNTSTRK